MNNMSVESVIILTIVGVVLILLGLFFLIAVPIKTNNMIISNNDNLDPKLQKLLKMFGGDISAIVGQENINMKVKLGGIDRLFKQSGNPWKLSPIEFVVLKYVLGIVGIIVGLLLGVTLFTQKMEILAVGALILVPMLCYNYPVRYYNSLAINRENKFKSQLPEAIDYLTLALSGGGYSLASAFEKIVEYLPNNSIIKNEFNMIVEDLKSGKTMENALLSFADRAPSDGVKAFAKALNNANKLSVSQVDILKTRAIESRRALENEIDKRIATLDSRITMIFSPSAAISLGITVLAPTMHTLSAIM